MLPADVTVALFRFHGLPALLLHAPSFTLGLSLDKSGYVVFKDTVILRHLF